MQKQDIAEAYERIKPDEAAKERMLQNIIALAEDESLMEEVRMSDSMGKDRKKAGKKFYYYAAAVIILLVPITAAAGHLLGLWDIGLGKQKVVVPVKTEQGEDIVRPDGSVEQAEQEVDMISLQGTADSAEFLACMEWHAFLEGYDTNGELLSKVGNSPTGFEEEYGEYLCYTQEMADKIDEICEKYQLSKLKGFAVADSYEDLCAKTGIGNICGMSEHVTLTYGDSYYYACGSFLMSGTAVVTGNEACMTDFEVSRNVKGTFSGAILNVGNMDDYKQWEYETKRQEKVLLANSSHKALIIAEKENSFIIVNLLGDIWGDSFDVSDRALEELADAFDFSGVQ